MVDPALVTARDITCEFNVVSGLYRGRRTLKALRGVSLELRRGEVIGIVGESGSGKSTLAKVLLGLQSPTRGTVHLQGRPLGEFGRRERASMLQAVFQDPTGSLNPMHTVESIVGLPLRVLGIGDRRGRRQSVSRMIDRVGLPSRCIDVYPGQLSGGQKQRVAIARALIAAPAVLICDEPTSALDVSVQAQIVNLLRDLQREIGMSIIVISHNLAVVSKIASRVLVMYLGRIVEAGPTEDIFRRARHPYTQALLSSFLPAKPYRPLPDLGLKGQFSNAFDVAVGCSFHARCPVAIECCARTPPEPKAGGGAHVECHRAEAPPSRSSAQAVPLALPYVATTA
jgi:peptide/nickel transport system ATP-binding protein